MSDSNYRPTGELQRDTKAMTNRGTRTGMNGDSYGADLSQDAINRAGSIGSATKSHAPDEMPGCNNKSGC